MDRALPARRAPLVPRHPLRLRELLPPARGAMTLDPEALFARARAGDAASAIAELDVHLARAPADFDAWLTLGLIASETRDIERARAALARAVDLTPSSLLARVAYARVLDPRRARRQL